MTGEHHREEHDLGAVCDFRLLCREMLQATIPAKRLKDAKAVSVDQTAFPTFFRSCDFRTQKTIDKAVRDALQQTGKIPDDVQLDRTASSSAAMTLTPAPGTARPVRLQATKRPGSSATRSRSRCSSIPQQPKQRHRCRATSSG